MKKTGLLLICLGLALTNCKKRDVEITPGDLEQIVVDIDRLKEEVDGSFLIDTDSVEVIILETNPECLIGNVKKVHLRKNKILVYDELTLSVFVFNRDGSFHGKIQATGSGPGEYPPTINDMVIMDSTVGVFVPVLDKIMLYDFNGNYICDISLNGSWGMTFFTFDGSKYHIVNDWSDSKLGRYQHFMLDTNKNRIECFLPFTKMKGINRGWGLENYYSLYNDHALTLNSTIDIIYEVLPNKKITPRYYVNIIKNRLPQVLIEGDPHVALDIAIKEGYLKGVHKIMETSRYLILDISLKFRVVYDKAKKEVIATGDVFLIPEFGGFPIYLRSSQATMENDVLINALNPEIIRHVYIDAFTNKTIKNKDFAKKYLGAVSKVKDDDNPVLIIYKMK
ncbi:MAG: 6-bladed beta-propeller [Tannerella sp.]|nr:6-bladed beta-propeller [Tannerella sp.]